jgi:pyrimidine-nucleoside phosphorylase
MNVVELIHKKRDGRELSRDEIDWLIEGFTHGTIADYQMSALCMAIVLRSMTARETAWLTLAMRDSGVVADLSAVRAPKIDKHSTGGVGDKVSLCLAPLVAACGVAVPMISGRGLGHTGGTLDKLEAIPGFRIGLDLPVFQQQVRDIGCALIGQTESLAPADKRLYALRDVTGTVESIPLITASILSKKLAAGLDGLVMDVKVGRGAFMHTLKDARALAKSIVSVGRAAGLKTTALITAMDQPLGMTIGNALETREAIELLHGRSAPDLLECTLALGAEMLVLGRRARSTTQARDQLHAAITSGSAASKLRAVIQAQGGDARVVDEPDRLPSAPVKHVVTATRAGYVTDIDALTLGRLSMELGAGRRVATDTVDPRVGIELCVKPGSPIKRGDALAVLHMANADPKKHAEAALRSAFTFGARRPKAKALVVETVRR